MSPGGMPLGRRRHIAGRRRSASGPGGGGRRRRQGTASATRWSGVSTMYCDLTTAICICSWLCLDCRSARTAAACSAAVFASAADLAEAPARPLAACAELLVVVHLRGHLGGHHPLHRELVDQPLRRFGGQHGVHAVGAAAHVLRGSELVDRGLERCQLGLAESTLAWSAVIASPRPSPGPPACCPDPAERACIASVVCSACRDSSLSFAIASSAGSACTFAASIPPSTCSPGIAPIYRSLSHALDPLRTVERQDCVSLNCRDVRCCATSNCLRSQIGYETASALSNRRRKFNSLSEWFSDAVSRQRVGSGAHRARRAGGSAPAAAAAPGRPRRAPPAPPARRPATSPAPRATR